jgi:glycosyltransferase involved in cell wall biosynthesis
MAYRRITLVTDELLGYPRAGGLGTATSFLAVALGRLGHEVEVLYVGETPDAPPTAAWAGLYEQAGVTIQPLARSGERTEPPSFARLRDVERALRATQPEIVITQDLAAPAYTALRSRQLGLGFEQTLFVVYCHGTRRWITDVAGKVRVLPGAFGVSVLEQASIGLADVVVSPSSYLLDWMRSEHWPLPQSALVIPYLTRSVATGDAAPPAPGGAPLQRISFFGRLEERKGLVPFAEGLNAVERELLHSVQLEFVGRPTPAWPPERVLALLSEETRNAVGAVSFQTQLDQSGALARLSEAGTLAVIPSLEDNSPNAVYECLERGIPFLASSGGGIAELVEPQDRGRTLFEPTAHGVASALSRALALDELAPARFAFDPRSAVEAWQDLLARPAPSAAALGVPPADVSVVTHGEDGIPAGESEWVVILEEGDRPDDDLIATLTRAQAASASDVATCAVRLDSGLQHYFLGDPGAVGALSNAYGTVMLVRRALLDADTMRSVGAKDRAWPVLARLALAGAKIVSVPRTLATTDRRPGDVKNDPLGGLAVAREFEGRLPEPTRGLARLAAGLEAQTTATNAPAPSSRVRRLTRLLPGR